MYLDILILVHILAEPSHGYQIRRRVERSTGGTISLNPNTLYPALRRFEEMGAVAREPGVTGDRAPARHVYRITDLGLEVLHAMVEELPDDLAAKDEEFYVRASLLNLLEPELRQRLLEARRRALERRLSFVTALLPEAREEGVAAFGARVLELQEQLARTELAWLERLQEEAGAATGSQPAAQK